MHRSWSRVDMHVSQATAHRQYQCKNVMCHSLDQALRLLASCCDFTGAP